MPRSAACEGGVLMFQHDTGVDYLGSRHRNLQQGVHEPALYAGSPPAVKAIVTDANHAGDFLRRTSERDFGAPKRFRTLRLP